MNSKRNAFVEWKTSFVENFNETLTNSDTINELKMILREIIENGRLRDSFGENTDTFLNGFCIEILNKILNTETETIPEGSMIIEVLYSLSYVFSRLIVTNYDDFLQKSSVMFLNENLILYNSSKKEGELFSEVYEKCLKTLSTPQFMTELSIFFSKPQNVTFSRLYLILNIVDKIIRTELFQFYSNEFLSYTIPCVQTMCLMADHRIIKNYDEQFFESFFQLLMDLSSECHFEIEVISAMVSLYCRVYVSESNDRKDSSLGKIMKILQNPQSDMKMICSSIRKSGIIQFILKSEEVEFVGGIAQIFIDLSKQDMITLEQYQELWELTKANSKILDLWGCLLRDSTKASSSPFFNCIISENHYSIFLLKFLISVSTFATENEKSKIFRQLSELYFDQNTPNDLYINAICSFLPKDADFCNKIQSKCLSFIKTGESIEISLPLLRATLNYVTSSKSIEIFEAIYESNRDDSFDIVIASMKKMEKIEPPFVDKFIELFNLSANRMPIETSAILFDYLKNKPDGFNSAVYYRLLDTICKIDHHPSINLIKRLYSSLSPTDRVKGIDSIWSLLFLSGDDSLSKFLVTLFGQTQNPESIQSFIDKCMDKIDTIGALVSLERMIHFVEDGVDRDFCRFIPINRYLSDDECLYIPLRGAIQTMIRVPSDISFRAFKSRVSLLIQSNNDSFSLINNDKVVTGDTFVLNCNSSFEITIWNRLPFQSPIPTFFPSQFLSQEKHMARIISLLTNQNTLSPYALKLANLLPTSESENNLLRSFGRGGIKDWVEFLPLQLPSLTVYRINFIGSLLSRKHEAWNNFFFESGGAKVMLGLLVFAARKVFSDINELILLLRVCKLMVLQEQWTSNSSDAMESFRGKAMDSFISFILEYINCNDPVLVYLMDIIRFFDINIVSGSEIFPELIRSTLFHDHERIRKFSGCLISQLDSDQQSIILFPYIGKCLDKQSDVFLSLLVSLSENTKEISKLWDESLSLLYSHFYLQPSDNPIEILNYDLPSPNFAQSIINILYSLSLRMNDIPDRKRLLVFLIKHICLNCIRFYEPSKQIFGLINRILNQSPEFAADLAERIKSFHEEAIVDFPSSRIHPTSSMYKGLMCEYKASPVSSLLQQFYYLPVLPVSILRQPFESLLMKNFQCVFAFMKFLPVDSVDISSFLGLFLSDRALSEGSHRNIEFFYDKFIESFKASNDDLYNDFSVIQVTRSGINDSITEENVNYIKIDIGDKKSLVQYLDDKFNDQTKDNLLRIRKAPRYLVFSLQRFSAKNGETKLNNEFSFPDELSIAPYLDIPTSNNDYRLCGIIAHEGSYESGRCVSYVNIGGKEWVYLDGSYVKQIFERPDLDGGFELIEFYNDQTRSMQVAKFDKSKSACMLFYVDNRIIDQKRDITMVDSSVVEILMKSIKNHLFSFVFSSTEFSKVAMTIFNTEEYFPILYSHLICCFRVGSSDIAIVTQSIIDFIKTHPDQAEFVMMQLQDPIQFLIVHHSEEVRKQYEKLLLSCIDAVSLIKRSIFLESLVTYIYSHEGLLIQSWRNLSEYFSVIESLATLDKYGIDRFFEILFSFSKNTLMKLSKDSSVSIINSINLRSYFSALSLCARSMDPKSLTLLVCSDGYFEFWIVRKAHFSSFSIFVSGILRKSVDTYNIFLSHSRALFTNIESFLLSQLFCFSLYLDNQMAKLLQDQCIRVFKSRSSNFKKEFCLFSIERIPCIVEAKQLFPDTKELIFSIISDSHMKLRLLAHQFCFSFFPHSSSDDYLLVYNTVFSLNKGIKKTFFEQYERYSMREISKDHFIQASPVYEHFQLLKFCVANGKLHSRIIDNCGTLISLLDSFSTVVISPNYAVQSCLDLILFIIGDSSQTFFVKHSAIKLFSPLVSFITTIPDVNLAIPLINVIPNDRLDKFFTSTIFASIIRDVLPLANIGQHISSVILSRVSVTNAVFAAKSIFEEMAIRSNISKISFDYFLLAHEILKRFPSVVDIFFNQCLSLLWGWQSLKKNVTMEASMSLISLFNQQYLGFHKDEKKLFGGTVNDSFRDYWDDYMKVNISYLIRASTDTYPGPFSGGICSVIASLIRLSNKYQIMVLDELSKLKQSYLSMIPQPSIGAGVNMIVSLWREDTNDFIDKDSLIKLLRREIVSTPTIYIQKMYQILCTICVSDSSELLEALESILENKDIRCFCGKAKQLVLLTIGDNNNEKIERIVSLSRETTESTIRLCLSNKVSKTGIESLGEIIEFTRALCRKGNIDDVKPNISAREIEEARDKDDTLERKGLLDFISAITQ